MLSYTSAHARFARAVVLFLALLFIPAARAAVVISEINYRGGTGFPENTDIEFVELHNNGALAVNIGGWAFTSGVSYTFPAGTIIAAGGWVVVGANPAGVDAAFGFPDAFGPWVGSLSNNGEKIELSQPGALAGTWTVVDAVSYASEGDWATRVRETTWNGWAWSTLADGGGRTMELRNVALSNDNGQNWAPSTAPSGGTPGAANTVASANIAPVIRDVKHSPAVPKPTDNIVISCRTTDESAPAALVVMLNWRDATTTTPGSWQTAAMTADATGKFSATLAPMADLTIVEFYISADDGAGVRTWPAATSEGQNANCQLQVDAGATTGTDSYYRLVLTAAENNTFNNVASSSDRQFNMTLVSTRGADTTIRYRSQMRIRGNSSRSYMFRPLRISLPADDTWDGVRAFNLNPRSPFLQHLGMRAFQTAGLVSFDTMPVELRRNGVESTTSGGSTPDFGKWVRMEENNGDAAGNHWPGTLGDGNLYKKGRPDEFWRATQNAPASPDALLDGWSKQNNTAANDWSDLTTFFQTWQATAAPHFSGESANDVDTGTWDGTAFSAAQLASVETVSDLDQWARWFAVMTILQSNETNISNGQDDDYACYFVPAAGGQRRMQLLPHDLDTVFGLGDSPLSATDRGLYDATAQGSIFKTLLPLLGNSVTTGNATFRTKYFTAIRELYGTVLDADNATNPNPPFYAFVDNHLAGWVPAATRTAIKTFATQRQAYLLDLIADGVTGGTTATPIAPPAATSSATFTSAPSGTLMIHEVLAHNVAAHANAGTFPDVIELRNTGAAAVDFGGKSLTDDPALPGRYVFPAGTTIAAGGYLVVHAAVNTGQPGLHTGFALDAGGDQVRLYDSVANGGALLDAIAFGPQAPDLSIGRTGAALDTWRLCTPGIGGANTAVATLGAPGGVVINEWLGNPKIRFSDDFIELHNPAAQPVALGGMSVTDDFIFQPARHVLPPLSFIAPGGFLTFTAKGAAATPGDATELAFGINASFGTLALIGANGTIVDRVSVVAQPEDASTARSTDGSATYATRILPGSVATPGITNGTVPANVLALLNNLRVTELHYFPTGNTDHEFIELMNAGTTTLDLTGVRISNGVDFTFGPAILQPGARLLVVKNAALARALFGNNVNIAGVYAGRFDNNGESITIQPPAPYDAACANFRYESTWYPSASGGGSSIQLVDAATPPREYEDSSSWQAAPVTPVAAVVPVITSALSATAGFGDPFTYQVTADNNPYSFSATGLPSGLAINQAFGTISGTPAVAGVFNVVISATNGAGSDTETLVLTVTTTPPPVITSAATANGVVGSAFSYQITATNSPTSFSATGLPAGLTVNTANGLISGTPTANGVFTVTVGATNPGGGTGTLDLTLTITLPPAPVITSAATAGGIIGDAFNYQITATNSPTSYGATGLPAGLSLNPGTGTITGTLLAAGVANITLSATNPGGTGTLALTLTVTTSGPLASFVIEPVAATQQNGVPFPLTMRAVDAQGRTVTTFNGTANLTGQGAGISQGIVLITECGTAVGDYWEIQNVGNAPLNTAGWFIVPNNGNAQTGGVNFTNNTWELPASIAPGQIIAVTENQAGVYPFGVNWGAAGSGWCMLCDNTGAVRDFVAWGYTRAQLDTINLSVTMGASNFNGITVPSAQWTTDGTGAANSIKTRGGTTDGNSAADWTTGASEANKGAQNAGLTVPFIPPPPTVAVAPASAMFVNGAFSAPVTISQVIASMKMIADDGASHTGETAHFTIVNPPAPAITSPANAVAVAGQPFTFQLTATAHVATWTASPLPAGLALDAATGIISGVPAFVGTTSANLSATNAGGTGVAALGLEVKADSDGDGMPDDWETAHGLSPGSAGDSATDRDGDGAGNLAEFLAGTVPTNPASVFKITSHAVSPGGYTLTWNSVATRRYRVWRTTTMPGAWTQLTPAPLPGAAITTSYEDPQPSSTRAFYRVEAVQ